MNETSPLISVIIPIYKVEAYLAECVDSVLKQTYRQLEIILVDDGSPDACPRLCDEYGRRDARVKVIHKTNGGLSDARNVGLTAATGDYVIYLDSDDYWCDTHAMERMVAATRNNDRTDIVLSGFILYFPSSGQKIYPSQLNVDRINGKDKIDVLEYLTRYGDLFMSACQKLVRRELLIQNGIRFQKGLLSEDIDWSLAVYMKANAIYASDSPFYCYRQRSGSITTTMNAKSFKDLLYIIVKWKSIIPSADLPEREKRVYLGYLCYQYGILMGHICKADYRTRSELKKSMLQHKNILRYDVNSKTRKICTLYKYLGFDITSRILFTYIWFKYNR